MAVPLLEIFTSVIFRQRCRKIHDTDPVAVEVTGKALLSPEFDSL